MASPLRPGTPRALAQPYVQAAALRGLTGAQTIDLLRTMPTGAYRRTELLADLRHYKGAELSVNALRSVRRDFTPSARLTPIWHGVQKANFRYQLKYEIEYADGSSEVRKVTIESSRPLGTAQRDRLAQEDADSKYDVRARGGEVGGIELIGAWRRA